MPSLDILQWTSKNDRNPTAPTCEDVHQQWTQRCEEESRNAAWKLHKSMYHNRVTYQENTDTLFKTNFDSGAISQSGISHEELLFVVDSGASMNMMSESDDSEIGRILSDYHGEWVNHYDGRSHCLRQRCGHVHYRPVFGRPTCRTLREEKCVSRGNDEEKWVFT